MGFTEFINQPIVVTLLTLCLGSYLFAILSERRARHEKRREKSIEFIEEVSRDINLALSLLFGYIRASNLHISDDSELRLRSGKLLEKRLEVSVKSSAYLQSKTFAQDYDQLVWELKKCLDFMGSYSKDADTELFAAEAKRQRMMLEGKWGVLENVNPLDTEFTPLFNELYLWASTFWHRTRQLISTNLETIMD